MLTMKKKTGRKVFKFAMKALRRQIQQQAHRNYVLQLVTANNEDSAVVFGSFASVLVLTFGKLKN